MSSLAWCEAQNRDGVNGADDDSGWQYWYGLVADDEDMESGQAEDVYDMLAELATDKINLNRATREDLERLVFLTDRQLQDLAEYIDRYGPVRSLAELAMVPSIDAMRRRLLAFLCMPVSHRQRAYCHRWTRCCEEAEVSWRQQ